MLGNISCFLLSSVDFFQNQLFRKKIFLEYHQSVKTVRLQIMPDDFIMPDLDPNCLQILSADDTIVSSQRVKTCPYIDLSYWLCIFTSIYHMKL